MVSQLPETASSHDTCLIPTQPMNFDNFYIAFNTLQFLDFYSENNCMSRRSIGFYHDSFE